MVLVMTDPAWSWLDLGDQLIWFNAIFNELHKTYLTISVKYEPTTNQFAHIISCTLLENTGTWQYCSLDKKTFAPYNIHNFLLLVVYVLTMYESLIWQFYSSNPDKFFKSYTTVIEQFLVHQSALLFLYKFYWLISS